MSAEPVESHHTVNGEDLSVYEWPGKGPAILLAHATGFHARCWDQIVARLPGQHCVALDFRGHGCSSKPAPPYSWRSFGEDLAALASELGMQDAVACGHSMGGHAVALAAALNPRAFSRLILLDPVIQPESGYSGASEPLPLVTRRKNVWTSPEEMFERFKNRMPFQTWDQAILWDYCRFALSGKSLACPPEVEASIYAQSSAPEANIYAEIGAVPIPTLVVRSAEPYAYGLFTGSPTAPDLATRFQQGVDEHLSGVSHFIPMEAPDLVSRFILSAL